MYPVTLEENKSAKKRLAQLIKELRGDTTQREFARLLGTSYTTIQDWEKQIRLPSPKNLKRLAQFKGWTQAELLHYIFPSGVYAEQCGEVDPVERIITHLQHLSPAQMQTVSDYLASSINQQNSIQNSMQQ
jgi:transcriptional regulator with XRE-family HTH domain